MFEKERKIFFIIALSIQSGYSQANRVNLLAADYNNPTEGLGGSGIYLHDGTVASYYISGISSSKLLVSTVYPRGTPRDGGSIFVSARDIILHRNK